MVLCVFVGRQAIESTVQPSISTIGFAKRFDCPTTESILAVRPSHPRCPAIPNAISVPIRRRRPMAAPNST